MSNVTKSLVPRNETEAHLVSGSLHATHTLVGWIITGYECVMPDTYHLSTPTLLDEDSQQDFEELPDGMDIAFSNEDRLGMEIVNRTIKRVDDHKFQIAVPLRHITLNLPDNITQAENRIKRQRDTLKRNSDLIPKYCEKIKCLKTRRYIEKINPDETPVSGQVWCLFFHTKSQTSSHL